MKDKIIIFVIGLLAGAVIASGAFLIYTKTNNKNCNTQATQMERKTPPEKPDGESNNSSENSKKSKKSKSESSTDSKSTKKSDSETQKSN